MVVLCVLLRMEKKCVSDISCCVEGSFDVTALPRNTSAGVV